MVARGTPPLTIHALKGLQSSGFEPQLILVARHCNLPLLVLVTPGHRSGTCFVPRVLALGRWL